MTLSTSTADFSGITLPPDWPSDEAVSSLAAFLLSVTERDEATSLSSPTT